MIFWPEKDDFFEKKKWDFESSIPEIVDVFLLFSLGFFGERFFVDFWREWALSMKIIITPTLCLNMSDSQNLEIWGLSLFGNQRWDRIIRLWLKLQFKLPYNYAKFRFINKLFWLWCVLKKIWLTLIRHGCHFFDFDIGKT